jgi:hypothetical protein
MSLIFSSMFLSILYSEAVFERGVSICRKCLSSSVTCTSVSGAALILTGIANHGIIIELQKAAFVNICF